MWGVGLLAAEGVAANEAMKRPLPLKFKKSGAIYVIAEEPGTVRFCPLKSRKASNGEKKGNKKPPLIPL